MKISFKRPAFPDREMTNIELITALNWYNEEYSRKNCRKFIKEYLVYSERKAESKEIVNLPDKVFSTTAAWMANMLVNGAILPMSNIEFVENNIMDILEYSRENRIIDLNLL